MRKPKRENYGDWRDYNLMQFMYVQELHNLVWTDNDIAQGLVMPFTKRQLKIIDYAITQVQKNNIKSENDVIKIAYADMIRFLGLPKSGQLLEALELDVKHISNVGSWWRYNKNDPSEKVLFRFFERVKEKEKEDKTYFKIKFNQEFLNKLNNNDTERVVGTKKLQDGTIIDVVETIGFNNYEIWNTKNLKSKYGILLYKKCNSWIGTGVFCYRFTEMQQDFLMFDKTFAYISSHCLKVGIKDINNNSDIDVYNVEYKPNKKNVEYVIIYCRKKSQDCKAIILEDVENETRNYISNEQEKTKNYINDRSLDNEIKKQDVKRFERELIKKEDEIVNGQISIFDLIKEQEKETNKEFNLENIDYFVSEKTYKKILNEMDDEKRERAKELNISFEKYLDIENEEMNNILENFNEKEKEEMTSKKQEKFMKRHLKYTYFMNKYGYIPHFGFEEEIKHIKMTDEDRKEIEEFEKEEIERMRELVEEYDKKNKSTQ